MTLPPPAGEAHTDARLLLPAGEALVIATLQLHHNALPLPAGEALAIATLQLHHNALPPPAGEALAVATL
jgi:hypothetical protein